MKVVDVNVFVHATNTQAPESRAAAGWLRHAYASGEPVGLAWAVVLGFVRITTRRGIFAAPLSAEQAIATINTFLSHPATCIIEPTPRHWPVLSRLLVAAGTAGNLTMDAHLAALAIEHGASVVSFDRDFERFAGLSVELLTA